MVDGVGGITLSQALALGLPDFELIRVIGRGSYAKVLLVRLKKNEQMYAMKVVKKELVHDDEVSSGSGLKAAGTAESINRIPSRFFVSSLLKPHQTGGLCSSR